MCLVEHMKSTGHQRGVFGQCVTICYIKVRYMYNMDNNKLVKLHNMLFPSAL